MDKGSCTGLLLGMGAILAGLLLEGGRVSQLLQPAAATIVFGGTFGAVLLQFPPEIILAAFRRLWQIFFRPRLDPRHIIGQLIVFARRARRNGMVSLDGSLPNIPDLFLRKSLMLAIDGTEPQQLRNIMQLEIENQADYEDNIPRVFESAGGFAPTIGIIGAVLGLIQVMQHLDNINQVGKGIAVAFVATVYGVGAANLFFLPAAGKLRLHIRQEQRLREMTLEGVISILEGMNPRILETKLLGFLKEADDQEEVERDKQT
jgi:chemotaxis protein MotA